MQRRLEANWQHHYLATLTHGSFSITQSGLVALRQEMNNLVGNTSLLTSAIPKVDNLVIKAYDGDNESEADESVQEEQRVIVIPVKGTMLKYGTYWSYGTEELAYYIKYFANREDVAAIVLDVDTGGGATNSVPGMLDAIAYVQSKGKPIPAHVDNCYSAGMWIGSACDQIFLNNKTSSGCGSIGVMLSYLDIIPYFEELGAKYHEIYADESSDKNLAFQKLRKGEYEQMKEESLKPMALHFQEFVKTSRGGKLNMETPGLLSGATFSGQNAVDAGLADRFGTLTETINYAAAQAYARTA